MSRMKIELADVKQLPETHTQVIPEDFLDAMGHMNVMWYTHLFSMGFMGLMRKMNVMELFDTEHDGGSFALESHVRYLSEVRVGQRIRIHTRLVGRTEKRFHALHFMTNDDKQDVSATFEIVSSYVSLSQRRTVPLPPELSEPMDHLVATSNALTWDAPVCGIMSS